MLMSIIATLLMITILPFLILNVILRDIFKHRYVTFFIKNRLYICEGWESCGRLYRHYQATVQNKSELRCPHCSKNTTYLLVRVKEKPWMNYHSDCPRMNYLELIKFFSDVYHIKRNKQSVEEIEFFDKYSARKPNTDWINNITKNK